LGVFWVLVPLLVYAEPFTGKVVGISDGDTISVLREGKAVKVRLHGVDTPGKAQAFGTQAQKFTDAYHTWLLAIPVVLISDTP
jgi:endonuclease YncB( thermonuclease family)